MRYSSSRLLMFGSALALAALGWAAPGLAAETFQKGDTFIVARQGAWLMRGSEKLAALSQGQRLNVVATEGDWIGTRVAVNGRTVAGWIHKGHTATPTEYAQRSTRRTYSYQPGAAEGGVSPSSESSRSTRSSGGRFIMGHTPYGSPGYWRADRKISGY